MTTIAPPALIVGATRSPLPYGLFSTFTLRPTGVDRWESGVQFETGTCDPVAGIGSWACDVSDVQTITEGGTGLTSFTLTFEDQTTGSLDDQATAAQIKTALEGLSNVEPGDVTVEGNAGGPYTVTWAATLGNVAQMTATPTGGTGTVTIATVTEGYTPAGLPKTLTSNTGDVGLATPFTVYGHWSCAPVGYTPESAMDLATQHLLAREEARVEQALWTGDLGNVPVLASAAADTLASGTGVTPPIALKNLEDYIATEYGSLGVIHMTRGMAAALTSGGLLVSSGGRLMTVTGTPVAAGAGYPGTGPTGQAVAADTGWAFASPAMFGYRSEIFPSSTRPGDLFDRAQNYLYAVAERSYLLGFDPCGVGAVLIDLT